jgi:hypothetical protein
VQSDPGRGPNGAANDPSASWSRTVSALPRAALAALHAGEGSNLNGWPPVLRVADPIVPRTSRTFLTGAARHLLR